MISIVFLLFILMIIISIPIGLILAFISAIPAIFDPSFPIDIFYIVRSMVSGVNSFPILAVPMFILSGNIMSKGKLSAKLFDFFSYFIIDFTGGLLISVIFTCLFYGAISGSGPATTAAVGVMSIPILKKVGYEESFVVALVAVAGGLGVIIPPSIPFIFYGQAVGVSVSKMFIAGIIPGILIALFLVIYTIIYLKKNKEDKEKIGEYKRELRSRGVIRIFKDSFFALLCPIIILGSIYSGIASPTEAAVISVFYSFVVSFFIYKTINLKDIRGILINSIKTYSSILFIIAAATAFARCLTFLETQGLVSNLISKNIDNKIVFILVLNLILLIVGMILDTTPAILILAPILVPIATSYGIDPVHMGIIIVVNLAIGFVTPPLGVNLFVASSITGIKIEKIIKKSLGFILVFLLSLLLISFIPSLSLALIN